MSADNYLVIREEDSKWVAYMEFASEEEPKYTSEEFVTDTLVEAIMLAQKVGTEYGYHIELERMFPRNNIMLDKQSSAFNKDYFPRICKYCGSVQRKASTKINADGIRGAEFVNYVGLA